MSESNVPVAPAAPASPSRDRSEIWNGDLFGREREAALLIAYIENVGRRPVVRQDHRGFTISVDADYGVGKSYFLKRLAEELSLGHPVAFVDAWSDDLADEPLTAIAATLKIALADFIETSPKIKERWDDVAKKAGEVAKIVALGALKKGLGLLITGAAVDAAEGAINALSSPDSDALQEAIKEASKDAAEGTVDEIAKKSGQELMEERISAFQSGQNAISSLKKSLIDLVEALPHSGKDVPIVIIIDELDRCRPTYAVKLLEETKHLFDIPGMVFILGMNADQLSHSVAGAYGPGFEGGAYLRRFINRQYKLSYPDTRPLLTYLVNQYKIKTEHLMFPPVSDGSGVDHEVDPVVMIARYMSDYKFTARDSFAIMDIIQTVVALCGQPVLMPLMLPMILNKVRGYEPLTPMVSVPHKWRYVLYRNEFGASENPFEPEDLFVKLSSMTRWSQSQITTSANQNDLPALLASNFTSRGPRKLASIQDYIVLLESVGQFSEPTASA